MTSDFFDEQEERSAVKTAIVTKYFKPWSAILAPHSQRIAYLDLYSGPGRFDDGTESTPLLILRQAILDPVLRVKLLTAFNDENAGFVDRLGVEINALDGIEQLRHRPLLMNLPVGEELTSWLSEHTRVPTLSFLDPWGYKGLSRQLIHAVVKDFGCEAIFFFNYNRINPAIQNGKVEPHMEALFGEERLGRLQTELPILSPVDRERLILGEMGGSLEEILSASARLALPPMIPFRFSNEAGRPTHYVCFQTKHRRGYMIMKDIMANLGIKDADGVPQFQYLPSKRTVGQLSFQLDRPLLQLPESLKAEFAGRSIGVGSIIEEHNVGTPFIAANYREVISGMEANGEVVCNPPAASRSRRSQGGKATVTLGPNVLVTFPRQS